MMPVQAFAADSGICGSSLTWTLDDNGTLTISGTGSMNNYEDRDPSWINSDISVKNVIVEDTVGSISKYLFDSKKNLETVSLGEGISYIPTHAFYNSSLKSISFSSNVKTIADSAFGALDALTDVYYGGTQAQWNKINIGSDNNGLTKATIHYMGVEGYKANVSTTTPNPRVGTEVRVYVEASHSSDNYFNAAEITLTYDNTRLSFNKNDSTLGTATVTAVDDTITLADYGTNKTWGSFIYGLAFDAIAEGDASVTMTEAAFINKEGAVSSNLISAEINPATVNLTIGKQQFDVTLPEDPNISGGNSSVVENGSDYTFSVNDLNYIYEFSAIVNGQSVEVINNNDGTYTIKNVTGELKITLKNKTPKTFNVSFEGNAANEITGAAATATYMTDYSFTVPSVTGWAYTVEGITIGGVAYTGYAVENSVCTIPGSAITDAIVITVNKVQVSTSVTVNGTGAGAAAGFNPSANIGEDYTLTIVPEAGYEYTVTATMGGNPVEVVVNGNTYTVKNVTGELVFIIEKSVITSGVTMSKYVTLDARVMWLVKNSTTVAEGKVPTSDGDKMFWSEKYNAYCYLIVSNEYLTLEEVKNSIGIVEGTADEVDYNMDINCTGTVDASDAQLTYNIYNAMYSGFSTEVTVQKFFRADVNGDGKVNVEDAAAIISHILA